MSLFSHKNIAAVLALISILSINSLTANNIRIKHFNTNDGLSSDDARQVFQDREGFIWICTSEGLNRFDGYEFKVFKPDYSAKNGFNTNDFTCICEDLSNNLWVGTKSKGINVYNKQSGEVKIIDKYIAPEGSSNPDMIKTLYCDQLGRIWIGTDNGLYRYEQDGRIVSLNKTMNQSRITINHITGDTKGNVWVGTWGAGLIKYNGKDVAAIYMFNNALHPEITHNVVRTVFEDESFRIWMGTWHDGLFYTQPNSEIRNLSHFSYSNDKKGLLTTLIHTISQDNTGDIWAGTPFGLNIIHNVNTTTPELWGTGIKNEITETIGTTVVQSIIRDMGGVMWVGTLGDGIFRIEMGLNRLKTYNIPDIDTHLKSQITKCFLQTNDEKILLGVQSLGMVIFDKNTNTFKRYNEVLPYSKISDEINTAFPLFKDSKNNIWIGERYGKMWVIDSQNNAYGLNEIYNGAFANQEATCIFEDSKGYIWIGTRTGLHKLIPRGGDVKQYVHYQYSKEEKRKNSLSSNYITTIFEDSQGTMWFGTYEDGIDMLNSEPDNHVNPRFRHFRVEHNKKKSLNCNSIMAFYEPAPNTLFVGTMGGGLNKMNTETGEFTNIKTEQGFPADVVYDILSDDRHNIWLTTNKGLVRFNKNKTEGQQFEIFNASDGLISNALLKGAFYKDGENNFYIGTPKGFNVFNLNLIKENSFVPNVAVTAIKNDNHDISTRFNSKKQIEIEHTQRSFSVEFSALSNIQPEKNKFAYMLEGFDNNWIYTNAANRKAIYSNLRPGTYTFKVKASNNSGLWSKNPATVVFRILPAPYETWWAFTLYFLGIIGMIIAIIRFLNYRHKLRQQLQLEYIERVKSDKINQFKLRFFTNITHEILTPLNIISTAIEKADDNKPLKKENLEALRRNANRLNRLISQLLYFRKAETGNMKLEVSAGNFLNFVKQVANSFEPLAAKHNISLSVEGNETDRETYFDADKIDKILYNLISNAIKFTPQNGSITIKTENIEEGTSHFIKVEISDTGKGIEPEKLPHIFERFFRAETDSKTGTGIGLELSKTLIEMHRGSVSVESTLGKGTTFCFMIPVNKEVYDVTEIIPSHNLVLSESDNNAEEMETEMVKDNVTNDKPTILIVEDNSDFRRILANHFADEYNVSEAKNGIEGLNIAIKLMVDIIITDVMMPEMDGYELCAQIKNNIETSHIPIVMLTAKVSAENRMQGYNTGADSYIEKPVNLEMLSIRVRSLLDQRQKLQSYFKSGITLEPENVKLTSVDEKFVLKAKEIIDRNIDNPDFNVNQFVKEMGTSNSMLYRKLTTMIGMSPVEFIKNMRLKRAVQLLKEQKFTISEVAYATGFNDTSYFTVCFKKQFGITPTEFVESVVNKKD